MKEKGFENMKLNRIGKSELLASQIGLGCMSLGTDEAHATSIIDQAIDLGINYLDTADLYDAGLNEQFVGKAIKHKRQSLIIATKVGNRRIAGQEGWQWDASKAYIMEAVKGSLMRLNTDYIDLYQLHGGMLEDNIDETVEAFEQLKREGIIREYGISSIRPNVIREYVKHSNIVSVMNQYSIIDRRAEEAVLPLLEAHHISVIARGPLASGALATGREPIKSVLDYSLEELNQLRGKLEQLTPQLTQLALRYSLHHPAVAVVVPGASTIEQLRANVEGANMPPLSQEEITYIQRVSKQNKYIQHR